jgi:hypothetical protein
MAASSSLFSTHRIMRFKFRTLMVPVLAVLAALPYPSAHSVEQGFLGMHIGQTRDGRIVGLGDVDVGSPAEQAGLVAGDQIIQVNGKRVTSKEDALKYLDFDIHDTVILMIVSKGKQRNVVIPLVGKSENTSDAPATGKTASDFDVPLAEAVSNYFLSDESVYAGGRLERTETLTPTKMPEALLSRVQVLAKLPADERILCVQIADNWHNTDLSTFEPHSLAVLTSKAIYCTGGWDEREKRGFFVDRIAYKDLMAKIQFKYERNGGKGQAGTMEFDNGQIFRSTSETVQLLHIATQVMTKAAMDGVRAASVQQKALPEADVKAIKGFGPLYWDATRRSANELLVTAIDDSTRSSDYENETAQEVAASWAHYARYYPGIQLTLPLSTVQYDDRSGEVTLHFIEDKLKMVERQVADDIREQSNEALANMVKKYGAARIELCDFRMDGDRCVRYVWETEFGRVIALCDAWYPVKQFSELLSVDGNEMRFSMQWMGKAVTAKVNSDGNKEYETVSETDTKGPDVLRAKGAFVSMRLELENKNPAQTWPFEASAKLQIIDRATMTVVGSVDPVSGPTISHRVQPYAPNRSLDHNIGAHYLFDLPEDKIADVGIFFRLELSPVGAVEPFYGSFVIERPDSSFARVEMVESLFDTLKLDKSENVADLVPPTMKIQMQRIGYNSASLISDVAQRELDEVKAAREKAAVKAAEDKAKIGTKALNDL